MNQELQEIIKLVIYAAIGVLPTSFILLLIFFYFPEKVQKWAGMIAWFLSFIWTGLEYFSNKNELEGRINSYVNDLEASTSIPFPRILVKFTARNEKEEIILDDYDAIVVIRDRNNRTKNFIHSVYFFTSEMLLRKSKGHLSKAQKISVDIFATKNILEKINKPAVEQFINDYFSPNFEKSDEVRDYIKQFYNIDSVGMFFPILIQELAYLGGKIFLEKPSQEIIQEVRALINYLENFSKRNVGDNTTPEIFMGKYAKCSIRIVATRYTRETRDMGYAQERIKNFIKRGCENVYIIGNAEEDNKKFINQIVDIILDGNEGILVVREMTFNGRINLYDRRKNVKTYFVHLRNPEIVKNIF